MKEFSELIECVVNISESLNRIANSLEGQNTGCCSRPAEVQETKVTPPSQNAVVYPEVTDRAALLEMCKIRGIEVPKQTKSPTLLKKIKAYDVAHGAGSPPVPAPTVPVEEKLVEEKPVEEKTDEVDIDETVDPFDAADEPDALEEPEAHMSVEDLRGKAMVLRKDYLEANPDKVAEVGKSIKAVVRSFGVELLDDLPVEKTAECLAKFTKLLAV